MKAFWWWLIGWMSGSGWVMFLWYVTTSLKASSPPPSPEVSGVYEEKDAYEVAQCGPYGAVVFDPASETMRLRDYES